MQDNSITAIGRATGKISQNKYENFIQEMFPGQEHTMLSLDFNVINDTCTFKGVDTQTVSKDNYKQYAYRKGSARGGDITFTTKMGDITKKFNTFLKQLSNFIKTSQVLNNQDDVRVFRAVAACIEERQEDIMTNLKTVLENFDKKIQQKCGFTLTITENKTKKYLVDFPTVQHVLIENGTNGKSEKYSVRSEGKDKTCSICLENKPLVHGFASPYKFSTVDKPGMVSGFFNQKNNWKNYPICSDCAFDFEMGRDYISQYLQQNFYGRRYFIIPQTILKTSDKFLKRIIEKLQDIKYQATADAKSTISIENYIMRQIAKEFKDKDLLTLNLLFFEENPTTKAMKIKLALEEVLPSRFKTLFIDAPKNIEDHSLYKEIIVRKKEKHDLIFSFGILKDFFDADFYQIVQTVFRGTPISQDLLFARFMQRIRDNYNKSQSSDSYVEWTSVTVAKAHMVMGYFNTLELISLPKNSTNMEENSPVSKIFEVEDGKKKKTFNKEGFNLFLKENKGFLKTDLHTGLFAVGVLVRFLFNIQSANLEGNTPFSKKLHGYHLDASRIDKIYRESLSKIGQYTSFFTYTDLRDIISDNYTVNVDKLKNLSNDEISFYFVAGLEMGNKFKNNKTKNN